MEITEIDVDKIKINPNQPRKEFDKDRLKELAESIKENGLINPIQVKEVNGEYELIGGERRLKAHKIINKKTITAIVKNYNSKLEENRNMLLDNMHREDLSSIEKAKFLKVFMKENKIDSISKLSKIISVPQRTVSTWFELEKAGEIYDYGIKKGVNERIILNVIWGTKNKQLQKQVINKVSKENIVGKEASNLARVAQNSQEEVKEALFKNKISTNQAQKISQINDFKTRNRMIEAHNNIRNIDKSIEKNFEKIKPKNNQQLVKANEVISEFRSCAMETQKLNQTTIKSLMRCLQYIPLMDDKQLKKLEHFQNLFEVNLNNSIQLSENLKDKIKNLN